MVSEINQNILSFQSGIVIHGCNAQGVMGAGLARDIKDIYPGCYEEYKKYCNTLIKENLLGTINWFTILQEEFYIGNCITQLNYGKYIGHTYVSYPAIRRCLKRANIFAINKNLPIYSPKIGAGLGGGDWNIIYDIIEEEIDPEVNFYICNKK